MRTRSTHHTILVRGASRAALEHCSHPAHRAKDSRCGREDTYILLYIQHICMYDTVHTIQDTDIKMPTLRAQQCRHPAQRAKHTTRARPHAVLLQGKIDLSYGKRHLLSVLNRRSTRAHTRAHTHTCDARQHARTSTHTHTHTHTHTLSTTTLRMAVAGRSLTVNPYASCPFLHLSTSLRQTSSSPPPRSLPPTHSLSSLPSSLPPASRSPAHQELLLRRFSSLCALAQ